MTANVGSKCNMPLNNSGSGQCGSPDVVRTVTVGKTLSFDWRMCEAHLSKGMGEIYRRELIIKHDSADPSTDTEADLWG